MALRRMQSCAFLLLVLAVCISGHKKHKRGYDDTNRNEREVICPPPYGVLKVNSQSENIIGITNQGGLSNLMFMCGTTQVPYQAPVRWVLREGPGGTTLNVTIYEKRYKMVPLCCPGYTRNEKDTCVPKCKGNCTNGLCVAPGNCACYDGYALNNLGDCFVTCPCGCPNGFCRGNKCLCNSGYKLESNGVCSPVCINECVNGDCAAPDKCKCYEGYKLARNQDRHVCSPHCTVPCDNGECVAPDVCKCNNGYQREKNTGRCIPKCNGCRHGNCVAPYTCHCHKGYRREDEKCVPVCTGGCFNATCTEPDECTCFSGYTHTSPRICAPHCSPACQNAQCVSPDHCECYPGFMKKHLTSSYRCEPIANAIVSGVGSIVNAIRHR